MKIAAKAALKKRTGMTAADNELGSTTMAGQAHAASTALGAGPGVAAAAAPVAQSMPICLPAYRLAWLACRPVTVRNLDN